MPNVAPHGGHILKIDFKLFSWLEISSGRQWPGRGAPIMAKGSEGAAEAEESFAEENSPAQERPSTLAAALADHQCAVLDRGAKCLRCQRECATGPGNT